MPFTSPRSLYTRLRLIAAILIISALSAQTAFGEVEKNGSFTVAILDKNHTSDSEGVYWTIYRVHNNMTGDFYVGRHKTRNLRDSYLGSGNKIKALVKQYGRGYFHKEILAIYDNRADMVQAECDLIDTSNPKSLNIATC